jgi:hypothetical protein
LNTDDDLVNRLNQLDDDNEEFELEEVLVAAEFSDEEVPDPNDVDEW